MDPQVQQQLQGTNGAFYASPLRNVDNQQATPGKGPPEVNPFRAFAAGFGRALAPPEFNRAAYYTGQDVEQQAGANLPGLLEQSNQGVSNIEDGSIMQKAATENIPITDDDLTKLLDELQQGNPDQQVKYPPHISSPMERLQKNSGVGPGLQLK